MNSTALASLLGNCGCGRDCSGTGCRRYAIFDGRDRATKGSSCSRPDQNESSDASRISGKPVKPPKSLSFLLRRLSYTTVATTHTAYFHLLAVIDLIPWPEGKIVMLGEL